MAHADSEQSKGTTHDASVEISAHSKPVPMIIGHRRPPSKKSQAEMEAYLVRFHEECIQGAMKLKAKAETETAKLEARKVTMTPGELKAEGARVKMEVARLEKGHDVMLERASLAAGELSAAEKEA